MLPTEPQLFLCPDSTISFSSHPALQTSSLLAPSIPSCFPSLGPKLFSSPSQPWSSLQRCIQESNELPYVYDELRKYYIHAPEPLCGCDELWECYIRDSKEALVIGQDLPPGSGKTSNLSEFQFSVANVKTTATSQNCPENFASYKVLQQHGTMDLSEERSWKTHIWRWYLNSWDDFLFFSPVLEMEPKP